MSRRVRITFYGREEYIDLPATEVEFQKLLEAAKQLAARRRENVASHYRINISEEVAVVVAIAEIQVCVVHCRRASLQRHQPHCRCFAVAD